METTPAAEQVGAVRRANAAALLQRYGTFGIFVVLVIVANFRSDSFLTRRNLLNVLRQVARAPGSWRSACCS